MTGIGGGSRGSGHHELGGSHRGLEGVRDAACEEDPTLAPGSAVSVSYTTCLMGISRRRPDFAHELSEMADPRHSRIAVTLPAMENFSGRWFLPPHSAWLARRAGRPTSFPSPDSLRGRACLTAVPRDYVGQPRHARPRALGVSERRAEKPRRLAPHAGVMRPACWCRGSWAFPIDSAPKTS